MTTPPVTPDTTPGAWTAFLDDASPFAPGQPGSRSRSTSAYVGARSVPDTELPLLRGHPGPVRVRLGGGAGQVAGPAGLAGRLGLELVALEVTLRDPDDPAGNARRVVAAVDAARSEGVLGEAVTVHVGIPAGAAGDPSYAWLAAADVVAAAELALVLPLDGPAGSDLGPWIDAALDRELTFSLAGGTVGDAVRALRTTARLWGDEGDLTSARRWCRSWGCTDVDAAAEHLDRLPEGPA